jgi:hypothetical protein
MNLHRALLRSIACAALSVTVTGCEVFSYSYDGPQYIGQYSDRGMSKTNWQVSGEPAPEVPMPEAGPAPVAPHRQGSGEVAPQRQGAGEVAPTGSGQNK